MVDNGTQNLPDSQDLTTKKVREKSVRYPAYSLEECVDFLKIVHAIGGKKEAPVESLLSKLKITTTDNRRYKYLTSSAEIFGLVMKTSSGITPTEFGLSILYPINGDEQRKQLYFEAFNTPQVYQKIIERYKDMILPDVDALRPIFFNSGIAPNALDTAVNAFLASAKFAGVLDQNNRLLSSIPEGRSGSSQQQPPLGDDKSAENQKGSVQQPSITNATQGESGKPDIDVFKFEIPTTSGKKASILLPKEWVKDDIELLIKLLRALCPEEKSQ